MEPTVIFTGEKIVGIESQPLIFLAGPSPRSSDVPSWRPAAIEYLKNIEYEGIICSPEWRTPNSVCDFISQVSWEKEGLMRATHWARGCVLFWVPREMKLYSSVDPEATHRLYRRDLIEVGTEVNLTMPALTTNVEFGRYGTYPRSIYGRPEGTPHVAYLDWLYHDTTGRRPFTNLETACEAAFSVTER